MRRAPAASLALFLAVAPPGTASDTDRSAREIIQTAYDRMLNYPAVRSVTLHIHRGGRRVTQRSFDVANRGIEGRDHTLLQFTSPEYLRGSGLLVIQRKNGESDSWLYRPSDSRPRRVGLGQKGDSFYGSDLSIEDLEHHEWGAYDMVRLPDAMEQGVSCQVVEAVARGNSAYAKVRAFVDPSDLALLRVDFFRGSDSEPFKSLTIERGAITPHDGVLAPKWIEVRQNGRDAFTRVEFRRVVIDPEITRRVFSVNSLEKHTGRSLFRMIKEEEEE